MRTPSLQGEKHNNHTKETSWTPMFDETLMCVYRDEGPY